MTIIDKAQSIKDHLKDGFIPMLEQNEELWKRFESEANKAWQRGCRHYSARTIIEFLRHHSAMQQSGQLAFKINNNVAPDFARLYVAMYPERESLFQFRRPDTDELKQTIQGGWME